MRLSQLLATLCATTVLGAAVVSPRQTRCHCLPGDRCWPSTAAWDILNSTVGGRLVATVPIGSPCHDPNYDAAACAVLQESWPLPELHIPSSSSVMQPSFANQSCDPFTPRSQPCLLGNYISYAVDVSVKEDIVAALAFAQLNNIRIVVRNTGHDFFGRSTGAGALGIWTNHLKTVEFLDWSDDLYQGRAMKVGAGVLGHEAIEASSAEGLTVVTGECPTVGLAGGYTQGGGHSALTTQFGLAADQTLEFEVVTAFGQVVKASSTENSDLYWALSGGGGGTFGVVTSLTVRVHPESTIGGATIQLAAAYTTKDKFYEAVAKFHSLLPAMIDQGGMVVYYVNSAVFVINPITVYNSTAEYVRDTVLAPFTEFLNSSGIPFSSSYTALSYRDHYNTYMGPLPNGHIKVEEYQYGSRLIPRDVIENNNDAFQAVLRNLTENGVLAVAGALKAASPTGVSNAVNPVWRDTGVHMQLTLPWDSTAPWEAMVAEQVKMTSEFVPQIEAVTPGSGAYINEADFNQPNWQETFYGVNYAKLLEIKHKWDPRSVFYTLKGVGSEAWTVDADGRMCASI